jgi:hypothetical protein
MLTSEELVAQEVMAMLRSVQYSLASASTDSAAGWSQTGGTNAPPSPIPHPPRARSVTAAMMASSLVASSLAPFSASATSASFVSSADSGDLADFDEFTREVAARVIQFYWHQKHPPASVEADFSVTAESCGSLLARSGSPGATADHPSTLLAAVGTGEATEEEEVSRWSGVPSPTASLQQRPPTGDTETPVPTTAISTSVAVAAAPPATVPPTVWPENTSAPEAHRTSLQPGVVKEATSTASSLDAFAFEEHAVAECATVTSSPTPVDKSHDFSSPVSAPPPPASATSDPEAAVGAETPPAAADKLSSFLEYLDAAEHSHLHGMPSADEPPSLPACGGTPHAAAAKAAVPPLRLPTAETPWSEAGGALLLTDRSGGGASSVAASQQSSSTLAASVYDGVKSKMRDLRTQLAHKEQVRFCRDRRLRIQGDQGRGRVRIQVH